MGWTVACPVSNQDKSKKQWKVFCITTDWMSKPVINLSLLLNDSFIISLAVLYFSLTGGGDVNIVNSNFKRNMPKFCDTCSLVLCF